MPLNLIEICKVKYPGQIESGKISFRKPDNEDLQFNEWNVEGIPRPNEVSLLAESQLWKQEHAMHEAFHVYLNYIENLLNTTAQKKQYGSAIACTSYTSSTNAQWKSEAQAFVHWRDLVFTYAFNVQSQAMQSGEIPVFADFVNGIPEILWP